MQLHFPEPLRLGDRIGVTSPSAGVGERGRARIDFSITWLRQRGFEVIVGDCMSADRWVSGSKEQRATELTAMLTDPRIRAVVPPWGGAGTAPDLLDQLDYDAIAKAEPTWVVGYSDSSAWMVPLTLRAGLPTLHGDNLADTPYRTPSGLAHWLDVATSEATVIQRDSEVVAEWHSLMNATATEWKDPTPGRWQLHGARALDVSGTLIGGCIEVMAGIAGTPYGDVRAFGQEHGNLIVYLEAAEEDAFAICRHLHNLRYAGWFDHAVAILIGRTSAPAAPGDGGLTQREAVLDATGGLGLPIIFDMEIGHVPPHLPLLNGALARVTVDDHVRQIKQSWPRSARAATP
ncbi:S66 peptidase family protein [Agrococcus sp. Marseille-Q4369]|uniref:S66 family peptidase n=1 Tax=Agrococcus sp. Marseille-Q4369 TaxID=2810513 RepID=UPI001B8D923F|nr:S66 peptidase family protein [Agrococcus sp. Marseille-Q4369]QUW18184.1 LD-carboxypeptidase [Agrococcus sp. Marseille-Q4369]